MSGLDKAEVADVILAVRSRKANRDGTGVMAALRAELPVEVPGMTVNRLCASGLRQLHRRICAIRSGGFWVVVGLQGSRT